MVPEILSLEKRLGGPGRAVSHQKWILHKKKKIGTNQTSLRQFLKILCLFYFFHIHVQGLSEVVHFSKRQWQYQDVIKFYQTRVKIIQKGLPFIVRSLEITKFKVYTGKQHLLFNGK